MGDPFVPATITLPPDAATSAPTAILLHGILGSARNWRAFARRLVRELPAWRLVLVDLRNHGDSRGAPGPHTLDACVADVDRLGIAPRAIIGHSYGGKVAAAWAAAHPAGLEAAFVLDTPPSDRVAASMSEVGQLVTTLGSLRMPVADRAVVTVALTRAGLGPGVVGWMTTNLRREEAGWTWRFDLEGVRAMLADYFTRPLFPMLEATRAAVHVVRGGRSARWDEADVQRLRALHGVRLHTLPRAGHWLHVDDPSGLLDVLVAGLGAAAPWRPA